MLFLSLTAFLIAQDPHTDTSRLQDQLRHLIKSSGAEVAIAYPNA